jgi:phosphatidylserine/phosphatidylglycerophosphate/cardiolipin synthase-like enzyme
MTWLLLATGFTGAFTLLFVWQKLRRLFTIPASASAHFSPRGGCTEAVVAELHQARREVLVLAYSFTSRPITDALMEAKRRGVRVEVVLDHSNEKETHTDLPYLLEQGAEPFIDAHHAIAHNKVMVIDGVTVITGSFNFTNQAEHENAENLLILRGFPDLARQFHSNFHEHRGHARPAGQTALPAEDDRASTHRRHAA